MWSYLVTILTTLQGIDMKVMKLEFELPFPPTLNHYRIPVKHPKKNYCYIITSPEGVAYKKELVRLIKNPQSMKGNLHVSITFFPKTKAKFDIDNYQKALFDGLTDAGVWGDDSQIQSLYAEKGEPIKGGKVFITITKRQ